MATPVKLQETSVITENRQCRDPAVSRKCLCRVNEKEKARKPFFGETGKKLIDGDFTPDAGSRLRFGILSQTFSLLM